MTSNTTNGRIMDTNERIELLIRETLCAFERKETLPPDPALYSRVRQRLGARNANRLDLARQWRPALFAALLLANVSLSIWYIGVAARETRVSARQELIDILAVDLNMDGGHVAPFVAE
jgi:hypothetical protein